MRQISDATKNLAENTLNIIAECLQNGVIYWVKEKDKFDYKIIVYTADSKGIREEEEELKDGSDDLSRNFSVLSNY